MLSFDILPGGIASMLLNSTKVYTFEGWDLDVAVAKKAHIFSSLYGLSQSYSNLSLLGLNKIQRMLLLSGLNLFLFLLPILRNYNLIIVHNARLIKPLTKLFPDIPVVAFNHTGKAKQIDSFTHAYHSFTVNKVIAGKINKKKGNKKHTTCIPNAIFNLSKYKTSYSSRRPLIVGSLGRFVSKKGFDILIKACSNIKHIELYLGGDGPLKDGFQIMQNNICPHLHLLGWIDDLDNFFSKIDIFCLPSKFEPFGLVLIEAMSRGIPVISTSCDGPKEIISQGIDGILVPIGNIEAMSNSISQLVNNVKDRKRLGKNAREKIIKQYTFNTYSRKLLSSSRKVIESYEKEFKQ